MTSRLCIVIGIVGLSVPVSALLGCMAGAMPTARASHASHEAPAGLRHPVTIAIAKGE